MIIANRFNNITTFVRVCSFIRLLFGSVKSAMPLLHDIRLKPDFYACVRVLMGVSKYIFIVHRSLSSVYRRCYDVQRASPSDVAVVGGGGLSSEIGV